MKAPSFFWRQSQPRAFVFRFDDFAGPDRKFVEVWVFVVGSLDVRAVDAFDLHAVFKEQVTLAVGERPNDLCGFEFGVGAVIKNTVFDFSRAGVVVEYDGIVAGRAA